MTEAVLRELNEGLLTLTLNRPDKLNALSPEMMGALVDNLSRAATNPDVGAVVLTGAGRGFCAGGDIGALVFVVLDLTLEERQLPHKSHHRTFYGPTRFRT
jgi:2-(1,2-epoxy-1,2-dihydrophenyl)acetyl-CoA isomerase